MKKINKKTNIVSGTGIKASAILIRTRVMEVVLTTFNQAGGN